MMDPARHERLARLFDAARMLSGAERSAFLDRECADDASLRADVESLLAYDSSGESALEVRAQRIGRELLGDALEPAQTNAPEYIGRFRVIRRIGLGGMGAVYEASQDHPARLVAIKVLHAESLSGAARARFDREIRILGRLHHPGIAQVYEAGLFDSGGGPRPYLAMELIRGRSLLEHARALPLRERLNLFVQVCDAIAYAHSQNVIHRDLKPGNILVDEYGQPKVLDFGVARDDAPRTHGATVHTSEGQLVGTLAYMSPEQVVGNADLDARSDVYALGVLLYELLSGHPPYDLRELSVLEATRMIQHEEPTRLSAHSSTFRGDLDTIAAKALAKEPSRRYPSASDLAEDIRRFLAHEPIAARPPTRMYHLRMFVRRYRGLVTAACAVFVVLVAGFVGTSWGFIRARDRAISESDANAAKSRALADAVVAKQEADRARADAETAKNAAVQAQQAAERAGREMTYEAYLANLAAADGSLRAAEPTRARERLDACPEAMRGWEWRWHNARSDSSIASFKGDGGFPLSVAYSPKGDEFAVAWGADRVARIYNARDLQQAPKVLRGHTSFIINLSYSTDGSRLITASGDATARVWDAATGRELFVLKGHTGTVWGATFNHAGTRIATGSADSTARLWDGSDGKALGLLQGHASDVNAVAFSPYDSRLATASFDATTRLWDGLSGASVATLRNPALKAWWAVFSPKGDRVVTCGDEFVVRSWDLGGAALSTFEGHGERINAVAFSPDGTRIVTAGMDSLAGIWDSASGKLLTSLRGHNIGVTAAGFDPTGKRVWTASDDKTVRVWDSESGRELRVFMGHADRIRTATMSPAGDRLVTLGSDKTVRVWDLREDGQTQVLPWRGLYVWRPQLSTDGRIILAMQEDPRAIAFDVKSGSAQACYRTSSPSLVGIALAPSGRTAICECIDGTGHVWDTSSGEEVSSWRVRPGDNNSVFMSADGTVCATISIKQKNATVRDCASGRTLSVLTGHTERVGFAAFSPDGSRLATGSADSTARVWDPRTGTEIAVLKGHTRLLTELAYSPDGRTLATCSFDATARLWDAATNQTRAVLKGHSSTVQQAIFSADSSRLLTCSSDNAAILWDVESGKQLAVLRGHEQRVISGGFSPDGTRVVTASDDRTARLWDTATGRELGVLRGHSGEVTGAQFFPDGQRILTCSRDKTVRVWDCVPYRDRFPTVNAAREAAAKMRQAIGLLVDGGSSLDRVAMLMSSDSSLAPEEQVAARAEVLSRREHAKDRPSTSTDQGTGR